MVLGYRSGYLHRNALSNGAISAANGAASVARQASMMMCIQWRIIIIGLQIILRQVGLKLNGLLVRVMEIFRLHFCNEKRNRIDNMK